MFAALMTPEGIDAQIIVCQQVFRTMAGMEVAQSDDVPFDPDGSIDSVLHYRGTGAGALRLECSTPVACAFASRLMSIPAPRMFDEDVKDALGELVNMIGGNLKGLLPEETAISAPSVFAWGLSEDAIGTPLSSIEFSCEFGWFRVRLYGDAA